MVSRDTGAAQGFPQENLNQMIVLLLFCSIACHEERGVYRYVCMHRCIGSITCLHICVATRGLYHLPRCFQTDLLLNSTLRFDQIGLLARLKDALVFAFSVLTPLGFYRDARDQTQVIMPVQQTYCHLSHFLSPSVCLSSESKASSESSLACYKL